MTMVILQEVLEVNSKETCSIEADAPFLYPLQTP